MTYAEYLKQQGATEEEIKILATPVATKAFDAMQAQLATANTAREKAEADKKAYDDWYNTQALPSYETKQRELVAAQAEAARVRELLKAAQDEGLIALARAAGEPPANVVPPNGGGGNNNPAAPDLSKYATLDSIKQIADSAGDGLAALQDMVAEHMQLFPDKPLRVRELRKAATAAGKTVEQYWLETYHVVDARAAREKAAQEAHDKAMREEGRKAAEQEFASRFGNPDTRPLVPSASPLAPRPATGRDKQPWESNLDLAGDRVSRATKHAMEKLVQ